MIIGGLIRVCCFVCDCDVSWLTGVDAVDAGVIPKDLDSIYDNSPC